MHDFWNHEDRDQQSEQIQFLKNTAMLGTAIMLLTQARSGNIADEDKYLAKIDTFRVLSQQSVSSPLEGWASRQGPSSVLTTLPIDGPNKYLIRSDYYTAVTLKFDEFDHDAHMRVQARA